MVFKEMILPLEQKLEKENKAMSSEHRKYIQGHKAVLGPFEKAHYTLKKFRKKSKSKYTYDQKEMQYIHVMNKCQDKLDEYRIQGLKMAVFHKRRCYCSLLDKLCNLTEVNAVHHQQSHDLLVQQITDWKRISAQAHILPEKTEDFLTLAPNEINGESTKYHTTNGYPGNELRAAPPGQFGTSSPYRRSAQPDLTRLKSAPAEYAAVDVNGFPRHMALPPAPPQPGGGGAQVRAIYTHAGDSDHQLSFTEGDIINLIGEKADGWQYGHNPRNNRYGWFPLSFTEEQDRLQDNGLQPLGTQHRVKSMGDLLDDRSVSDFSGYSLDHELTNTSRRPKSLYETNTTMPPQTHNSYLSQYQSPGDIGVGTVPRSVINNHDPSIYQTMPNIQQRHDVQHHLHAGPSDGRYPGSTGQLHGPSFPPPPPPIAAPFPNNHPHLHHQASSSSLHRSAFDYQASSTTLQRTPSIKRRSPTNFPPPPPLPDVGIRSNVATPLSQTLQTYAQTGPGGSRSTYSSPSHHGRMLPTMSSDYHVGGGNYPPLPPPPPAVTALPPPPADYADEDTSAKNPMFANVTLRKTTTNDRSSPRIK